VTQALIKAFGKGKIVTRPSADQPHEADLLMLDCTKAKTKLNWHPRLDFEDCIDLTAGWYSAWHNGGDMAAFTRFQLTQFEEMSVGPTLRNAHSRQQEAV
jgi:CDP-glucose 4,6-dehydratase